MGQGNRQPKEISIPSGTIKSLIPSWSNEVSIWFQFLLVQLKAAPEIATIAIPTFQFLLVQLKVTGGYSTNQTVLHFNSFWYN